VSVPPTNFFVLYSARGGHAVVQFVEELCYKQEDRGFDSR
jgi:hypothetical protein